MGAGEELGSSVTIQRMLSAWGGGLNLAGRCIGTFFKKRSVHLMRSVVLEQSPSPTTPKPLAFPPPFPPSPLLYFCRL